MKPKLSEDMRRLAGTVLTRKEILGWADEVEALEVVAEAAEDYLTSDVLTVAAKRKRKTLFAAIVNLQELSDEVD